MSETVTPDPVGVRATLAKWMDPAFAVKTAGAALLGGAVLYLDMRGIKADNFVQLVAIPGLSAIGLHTVAKTLN